MKRNVTSASVYFGIFIALMALLAATICAAYVDLGALNLPIAMTISIAKTLLIILFFMHVRQGTRLTWLFAGAGFFWLMLLLGLAMSDYATRHWTPVTPF
jgi:cytochrome c oxidase subunit 4